MPTLSLKNYIAESFMVGDYDNQFFQYIERLRDGKNIYYKIYKEKNRPYQILSNDYYDQVFEDNELSIEKFLRIFENRLHDVLDRDYRLHNNPFIEKIKENISIVKKAVLMDKMHPSNVKFEIIEMNELFYNLVRHSATYNDISLEEQQIIREYLPDSKTSLEEYQIPNDLEDNYDISYNRDNNFDFININDPSYAVKLANIKEFTRSNVINTESDKNEEFKDYDSLIRYRIDDKQA